MKVYILTRGADYESEDIDGVYDSMEKAVAAVEESIPKTDYLWRKPYERTHDEEDYKEWRQPVQFNSHDKWSHGCDFYRIISEEVK